MDAPEPYSNEWYRRRLGRIETTLDRQDNELRDQYEAAKRQAAKVEAMERALADARATIGELMERLEATNQRLEAVVKRTKERFEELKK